MVNNSYEDSKSSITNIKNNTLTDTKKEQYLINVMNLANSVV